MTEVELPASAPERPSRLSWVAFGLSTFLALGLWTFVYAAASGGVSDNSQLAWPDPWGGLVVGFGFEIAPIGLVVAIVLDVIAGFRGGRSRLVAFVGGVLMASPILVYLVVWLAQLIANAFHH